MQNKIELEKELKSGMAVITKDNIHLYYEFMGEDDFLKHKDVISKAFDSRFGAICFYLNLNVAELIDNMVFSYIFNKIVSQKVFNIKDVLKPMDEYILEIKESEKYQGYINKK